MSVPVIVTLSKLKLGGLKTLASFREIQRHISWHFNKFNYIS